MSTLRGLGSGLTVQRCGFFVAPIPGHIQEMGLIIPILYETNAFGSSPAGSKSHGGGLPDLCMEFREL
jgi:hypothetical protein